jgi:hypothetical protein
MLAATLGRTFIVQPGQLIGAIELYNLASQYDGLH